MYTIYIVGLIKMWQQQHLYCSLKDAVFKFCDGTLLHRSLYANSVLSPLAFSKMHPRQMANSLLFSSENRIFLMCCPVLRHLNCQTSGLKIIKDQRSPSSRNRKVSGFGPKEVFFKEYTFLFIG